MNDLRKKLQSRRKDEKPKGENKLPLNLDGVPMIGNKMDEV